MRAGCASQCPVLGGRLRRLPPRTKVGASTYGADAQRQPEVRLCGDMLTTALSLERTYSISTAGKAELGLNCGVNQSMFVDTAKPVADRRKSSKYRLAGVFGRP